MVVVGMVAGRGLLVSRRVPTLSHHRDGCAMRVWATAESFTVEMGGEPAPHGVPFGTFAMALTPCPSPLTRIYLTRVLSLGIKSTGLEVKLKMRAFGLVFVSYDHEERLDLHDTWTELHLSMRLPDLG